VHFCDIPIDVLYNPAINKIKGTEMAGSAHSFVPIQFRVEHESMAIGGVFEVTYKTTINGIEVEERISMPKLREKSDYTCFAE